MLGVTKKLLSLFFVFMLVWFQLAIPALASTLVADASIDEHISLLVEPTLVQEGDQLRWNFNLSEPVPASGLTVIVSLLEDTDPVGSDIKFFVDGSANITEFKPLVENGLVNRAAVTLSPGATTATLVSTIIDDGIAEGPESITIGLTPGYGYSVDPRANIASFTIVEKPILRNN